MNFYKDSAASAAGFRRRGGGRAGSQAPRGLMPRAGHASKGACVGRAGNVTGSPRVPASLGHPRRARAPLHAPPRPSPGRFSPGARRRGRQGGGGGRRRRGGAARPGSARPPARGSCSAPGRARAAAVALAPGFGGTGAPRHSHGPGDPTALAHAQRRLLLGQQQRGEHPGPLVSAGQTGHRARPGPRAPDRGCRGRRSTTQTNSVTVRETDCDPRLGVTVQTLRVCDSNPHLRLTVRETGCATGTPNWVTVRDTGSEICDPVAGLGPFPERLAVCM